MKKNRASKKTKMLNEVRAEWADNALTVFLATGSAKQALDEFEIETGADGWLAMKDLLCNLMHLAKSETIHPTFLDALRVLAIKRKYKFGNTLELSRDNYRAEVVEEADIPA